MELHYREKKNIRLKTLNECKGSRRQSKEFVESGYFDLINEEDLKKEIGV